MSLSDLASLGSFVSGLAVLASLGFLYFQMRQMTEQVKQAEKNQQAVIRQGRANALIELNLALFNSTLNFDARGQTQDLEQLMRFMSFQRALFQHLQENYDQYRAGLLNAADYDAFVRSTLYALPVPGIRVSWRMLKPMFKDDFCSFMDDLIAKTPVTIAGRDELVERWNADIRAELSGAKN